MNVDRSTFSETLKSLKPALSSGGAIPELKHFWFDGKYLYAYDGGLGIRLPFEGDIKGGVLGSTLLSLVNSSTLKEIFLDVVKGELVVQMGRSKTSIPIMAESSNPWGFTDQKAGSFSFNLSKEFIEGLKIVSVLEAEQPKRSEHYGVVLFPSRDFIGLYSTDSKALASVEVDGKFAPELHKMILPHKFVAQLISLGKEGHEVVFTEDMIVANLGDIQVCSTLLDNENVVELPNVLDTHASDTDNFVDIPELLGEALSRANILAGPKENYVKLSVNKKELSVTGKLAQGSLNEKLVLAKEGGTEQIALGLKQLTKLSRCSTSFAIGKTALILTGKSSEIYILGAYEE